MAGAIRENEKSERHKLEGGLTKKKVLGTAACIAKKLNGRNGGDKCQSC